MGRYKEYTKAPGGLDNIPKRSRQRILRKTITNNFQRKPPPQTSWRTNETVEKTDENPTEELQSYMEVVEDNFRLHSSCNDTEDSESSESDDEQCSFKPNHNGSDDRLYSGSKISLTESKILMLAFIHRYSLPKRAAESLQDLINFHVPVGINVDTSYYKIVNYLPKVDDFSSRHYYCNICQSYLNSETKLTCESCRDKPLGDLSHHNFFLTFNLGSSLKLMLQSSEVQKHFRKSSKNSPHITTENISDITDGKNYKKLNIKFPDFSCLLNTDGIAVFNSSNYQLWPVFASVNELPYAVRRKHTLICGLWFGNQKPNFSTFFTPIVKMFNDLQVNGIHWNLMGTNIISKVVFPIMVCDSPARSAVIGMVNHNGKSSCPWCLHPGETLWLTEKSHKRILNHSSVNHVGRTKSRFLESLKTLQARLVSTEKVSSVEGIVEASELLRLKSFDIVDGNLYDYMHSALLGVIRYFTMAWFDSKNAGEAYYIGNKMILVDQRCRMISLPSTLSRSVRGISDMNYWKASEWRVWMLVYSNVLTGILTDQYISHFKKFCSGILFLLQDTVNLNEIEEASILLKAFSLGVSGLYGERFYTFNLHITLHAPEIVKKWGPLWSYSTFQFEHKNGQLLRLLKGTHNVGVEMCNNLSKEHCLLSAIQNVKSSAVSDYCSSVLCGSKFYMFSRKEGEIMLVGRGRSYYLNEFESKSIADKGISIAGNVTIHSKFIIKGLTYTAFKPGKRKFFDSIIACKNGFYIFKGILSISKSDGSQYMLLKCCKINMNCKHVSSVMKITNISSTVVLLDVNSLKCEKFIVIYDGNHQLTHICKMPNCTEID